MREQKKKRFRRKKNRSEMVQIGNLKYQATQCGVCISCSSRCSIFEREANSFISTIRSYFIPRLSQDLYRNRML